MSVATTVVAVVAVVVDVNCGMLRRGRSDLLSGYGEVLSRWAWHLAFWRRPIFPGSVADVPVPE